MSRSAERASPPHVLVVDDDEELCELLTLRLEHHGFRVTTEHNRRGALEAFERGVVDTVLLDLMLGDDNGLDLLVDFQQRTLDLPVIILTAHGSIDSAVEAMQRGAYGFLTKPFDDRELVQKLEHAVQEVDLRREVEGLRRIVGDPSGGSRLLGTSTPIEAVRDIIARVAPSDASVLILGESGTGKELAARSIHQFSGRRAAPFVGVNCGALPPELLESELFGHRRGAFTGADRNKDGLFAAAEGGTLFLDEIGDAPLAVQVKLLRVLEERAYVPVGETRPIPADVRIVAATNRDLAVAVKEGTFREDLFYRLHVVPVTMPPLRERKEDIPLLAEVFLARLLVNEGSARPHLSPDALEALMHHHWPGNVRELANVVQGAALLSTDGVLRVRHVETVVPRRPDLVPRARRETRVVGVLDPEADLPPMRVAREAFDRAYLEEALRQSEGNVSAAAKLAGRNRTDFHDLLRRHGIDASLYRS